MARTRTIHTLAYRLVADTRKFSGPMIASRKEVTAAKKVMRESITPIQRYENAQKRLAEMRSKNLINDQQFTASLKRARTVYENLTGVTDRQRRAEKLRSAEANKAKRIIDSQRTAVEKLRQAEQDLNRMVRRGLITEKHRRVEMQRTRRELGKSSVKDRLGGMMGRMGGGKMAVRGGIAGMLAGGAYMVKESLAKEAPRIDATMKFARQIRFPVEELQKFQTVAQRSSGMGVESFNMAMQRMIRRTSEAAQGTGEAVKAIEELGLNAHELAYTRPDRLFLRYSDALSTVKNAADRNRIAMKLFDTEGVKLVNTMTQGSVAIRKQAAQAANLGRVVSALDAKRIERYNDAIADMKDAWSGVRTEIAIAASDSIKFWADNIKSATVFARKLVFSDKTKDPESDIRNGMTASAYAKRQRLIRQEAATRGERMKKAEERKKRLKAIEDRSNQVLANIPNKILQNSQSVIRDLTRNTSRAFNLARRSTTAAVEGLSGMVERRRALLRLRGNYSTAVPDAMQAGSAEAFRFLNQAPKPAEQKQLELTARQKEEAEKQTEVLRNIYQFFTNKSVDEGMNF